MLVDSLVRDCALQQIISCKNDQATTEAIVVAAVFVADDGVDATEAEDDDNGTLSRRAIAVAAVAPANFCRRDGCGG